MVNLVPEPPFGRDESSQPTAGAGLPSAGGPARVSRADRLAQPLALSAVKAMAEEYGVCVRPLAMRRTELVTGQTEVFDLPCGATRESKCAPCARRAQRLRGQQCREGWHRDEEPLPAPEASAEQVAMLTLRADCVNRAAWDHVAELDEAIRDLEGLMSASGLRGAIPPNPTPVPKKTLAAEDSGSGTGDTSTSSTVDDRMLGILTEWLRRPV